MMEVESFFRFFLLPVSKPKRRIAELISHPRGLLMAVMIFLFLGIIYTISVQLAWMQGVGAAVEPFLKIPAHEYYYWQRFWQIPFFFITSILFAGVVRLLCAAVNGQGRFEQMFAIFCIAQTLPMFLTMWLPETIGFIFFPGEAIMPVWIDVIRQVAGIVWPVVITIIGIQMVEKIPGVYATLFTILAAIPMIALMVIFIR
jgi:hypothetical protein